MGKHDSHIRATTAASFLVDPTFVLIACRRAVGTEIVTSCESVWQMSSTYCHKSLYKVLIYHVQVTLVDSIVIELLGFHPLQPRIYLVQNRHNFGCIFCLPRRICHKPPDFT